jgi:hypothetical protein
VHLDQVSGQPTHEREAEGGERERECEVEEREGKPRPDMFLLASVAEFQKWGFARGRAAQTKVWAAS